MPYVYAQEPVTDEVRIPASYLQKQYPTPPIITVPLIYISVNPSYFNPNSLDSHNPHLPKWRYDTSVELDPRAASHRRFWLAVGDRRRFMEYKEMPWNERLMRRRLVAVINHGLFSRSKDWDVNEENWPTVMHQASQGKLKELKILHEFRSG